MSRYLLCPAAPILLLAATLSSAQARQNFAVLLASYNGWINYAFQADVAHLYHVMREGGIPEKNIITMVYDDIADNEKNPFKGKVFNSYDMNDVYKGAAKDYTGKDVNKDVFLAVLRGDKGAIKKLTGRDGKVLESGRDDYVFVLINDHGGPGVVHFWDGNWLKAPELNDTITYMYANKKYYGMMFAVDTCQSGSMFKDILPSGTGVYAMTATKPTEFGYMADCKSEYFGPNKTCLGSLFSLNWIYELQSVDRTQSSLQRMFDGGKAACEGVSTPLQYGDLLAAVKPQSTFFGDNSKIPGSVSLRFSSSINQGSFSGPGHFIPKHLVTYYTLKNQLSRLPSNSAEYTLVFNQIRQIESLMRQTDELLRDIPARVYGKELQERTVKGAINNFGVINWECYDPALETFKAECPGVMRREEIKHYALSQFGILIELCRKVSHPKVISAINGAVHNSLVCQVGMAEN